MIIPIGFDARTERRGYVTYALAAACVSIFLFQLTDAGGKAAERYMARYNVERLRERTAKEVRREIARQPGLAAVPPEQLDQAVEALLDEHVGRPEWEWTRRPWTLLTGLGLLATGVVRKDGWDLLSTLGPRREERQAEAVVGPDRGWHGR